MSEELTQELDNEEVPVPEVVESTEVESTEDVPEVEGDDLKPTDADKAKLEAKTKDEPVVSEFTPDFSYKFKGEVKQIPEAWRPLIKDEASQKEVRDLFERAEALPDYKIRVQEFEAKIGDIAPKAQAFDGFQAAFESAKTPGDHLEILSHLGYTSEDLKNMVVEVMKLEKMPEDQKKYFEQARQAELEKHRLMTDNESIRHELNTMLMQTTEQQMSLEVSKPEYSPMVRAFETANGEGSFEQLFLERGAYYTQREGRHVPPMEVMGKIAKEFAPFLAHQAGEPAKTVVKPKAASIPSVGTRGGSPTQPAIKSLDDLNKRYAQLTGQEE